MADMTATTLATYLPEQWSVIATTIYAQQVVHEPLMDHTWEPELGVGRGDTVNIPTFTESTTATKRSTFGTGASVTFDAVTEAQVQLLVNNMAYKAFRLPVEMSLQAMTQYVPKLTRDIGVGVALQIDTELAADNTDGFDSFTATGSDDEKITDDLVLENETVLNTSIARVEDRFAIVSPDTRADMLQIEVLRNQLYASTVGNIAGDKGQGFFGRVYTLDFYMSNTLEAGTNGTKNFVAQKEAIAYVAQNEVSMVKVMNIADGFFNEIGGWKAYGFKKVKANHGREMDAR